MTRTMMTLLKGTILATLAFLFCTKVPSDLSTPLAQNIGATSLVSPADVSTDNILAPRLSWETVSGATRYTVQVSLTSDFSTTVLDSMVPDTFFAAAGLAYKTVYYWRVQVHDASSSSDWTTHRTFTTIIEPQTPGAVVPKDSLTNVPTTLTLTWNSAIGAASYCVQVSSDTGFRVIVAADSTLADTSKVVSGLSNNTTYYWRVRSGNPGGASAWTAVRTFFTIVAAPKSPGLSLPARGAVDQPLSVVLTWNKSADAAGYYAQVATDMAFAAVVLQDSSLTDTTRSVAGLANGLTYYWRVRAKNDGGASAWSDLYGFTTIAGAPQQPALVLPADGAGGQAIPILLVWNKAVGAATYHVQVAADSGFGLMIFTDSTLADTLKSMGGLANNTKYFWRLRAKNPTGVSAWSAKRSFTTFDATLPIPVLRLPADGASGQLTSPVLSWQSVSGAKTYRVQVSVTSDFSTIFFQDTGVTDTSRTLASGTLSNNTTYYWRVRAENAPNLSNWTSPWRFTTIMALPQIPALFGPPDGATAQPLSLVLSWNKAAGAASYSLQVATDSNFATMVTGDTALTDTAKLITVTANNKTYYWRVSSKNAVGSSGWSGRRSFVTLDATLALPTLQSPQDGAKDVVPTVTLSWSTVVGASTYEVQVSTVRDFTTVIIDDATPTTGSKSIGAGVLSNSTMYYWKVMAKNLSGAASNWTIPWSFTTTITTPGTPLLVAPNDNAVDQPVPLSLIWTKTTGASTYYVKVATDTGFASVVSSDSTLTDTAKSIAALSNATTYYWKVKGRNNSGDGPWSAVRSFATIIAAPMSTVLSSPPDSAANVSLNPQLSWSSVTGAAAYHIQVSTAPDFLTGLVVDDSTYAQTTKAIGPLSLSTRYFWHVKAKNAGGASTWSSRWSFVTIPAGPQAPLLVSPADAATGQPVPLTLTWHAVPGASAYYISVSTDTGFASFVKTDSTLSPADTSIVVGGLANASVYYWHVAAKNAGGAGPFSGRRTFATVRQFALTITSVNGSVAKSPNQAQYDSATAVTLAATAAAGYHFTGWSGDVGGTANPGSITMSAARTVVANFVTDTPAVPTLVSPANGALGQPVSPKFIWNEVAAADVYCIQIARDSQFLTIIKFDTTRSPADTARIESGLSPGLLYYWHVQSKNSTGVSPWSAVRSFITINRYTLTVVAVDGSVTKSPDLALYDSGTVVSLTAVPASGYHFTGWSDGLSGTANPANLTMSNLMNVVANFVSDVPLAPTLTVPANNAVNVALSPLLGWASSATATKYHMQVSTLSDISGNIAFDDSTLTDTTKTVANLASYTTYFWRVNAKNSAGTGDWSAISKFITTLGAPPLNTPANHAVNVSHFNPTATWGSVDYATSYRMQVSTDSTFASTVTDVNGTGTSNQLGTALVMNTKYYWRVQAKNANGSGVWSVVFSFTTLPVPAAPAPSSPSNDVTNQPPNPIVYWYSVSGAATYRFQMSTHQDFSSVDVKDTTQAGTSIQLNGLAANTRYYWRTQASNADTTGPWATVWNFTTTPLIWTTGKSGLADSGIMALALNGTMVFAGSDLGHIFRSADTGKSWVSVTSGISTNNINSITESGGSIYAATCNGAYRSINNGVSWTSYSNGVPSCVTSIVVNGSTILEGSIGWGVSMSTDSGATWNIEVDSVLRLAGGVRTLAAIGDTVFAGTSSGGGYMSFDKGATWIPMNNGIATLDVRALLISGSNVFAGTNTGIYISTNRGTSWTQANTGLGGSCNLVNALAAIGTKLFAATNVCGVFMSTDNGANWTAVNQGLTNTGAQVLAANNSDIYVGTSGGGVSRSLVP